MSNQKFEYRKIQGLIGDSSLGVILPKTMATNISINKGEFVKIYQEEDKIIIQKIKEVS
jgi:antitoxin component of MazEF toxin-antitoxin module